MLTRVGFAARGPEWLVCLVATGLWFGCTAWLRPLAIPDEGRYVGVAWEMLTRRDWIVPTLDGLPFFHKPPLFYWITATAMAAFGPGVAAARTAAWLASVAGVTGMFAFVRHWLGRGPAWSTAAVLATTPLAYGAAQYANMDALVAACVSGAVLLFAHSTLRRDAGGRYLAALAVAFVSMALGVLAKGLIGIVLPALVLMAWGLATRRLGKIVALLTWGPGWVITAGLALPWFILVEQRYPDFGHYFVVVQHFKRYAAGGFNNLQPWWFYPAALTLLTLPWSPWLLAQEWKRLRDREQRPVRAARSVRADVRWLMVVWLAVVLLFFSLPSSKLVGYILPALAPLAFLMAEAVGTGLARSKLQAATLALAGCVCIAVPVAAHYFQPKSRHLLGQQLRELRLPGEPVWFLDRYYYDLAFYGQLDVPPFVVSSWRPADVGRDSWQRELTDAAQFDPTTGTRHLLKSSDLLPSVCGARSGWLVGLWPVGGSAPQGLAAIAPVARSGDAALWHIEPSKSAWSVALNCRTP